ncbi:MAG TPA: metallophosphoesterase [Vicinamibacterales bacterium]|nr:metallophosphoesterase [Vicinamibacterales bacterium]
MRTLVHLSDLHFGRIDPVVVQPLYRTINALEANLVAISGDFTQRARRSQFADARAFLVSLNAKTLVVPGNHDIPLYDFVERFAAPLTRYRRYISSDLEPEYQDEEMIVMGVNTARAWVFPFGDGRINERQVDRLVERMAKLPQPLLRIIVTHHPFDVPPGVHERRLLGRSAMAMARLAEANADLFLSGHLHLTHVSCALDRYDVAGHSALIVQAGTVSTRSRGEQPSFNVLHLERPNIEVTRFTWDDVAGAFVATPLGAYRHQSNGWVPAAADVSATRS